jgi:hypothetical protein
VQPLPHAVQRLNPKLLPCPTPSLALPQAANAGAVGVNFHQASGQSLYNAFVRLENGSVIDGHLPPQDGSPLPVVIRVPFYGLAMFAQAVKSDAQLLPLNFTAGPAQGLKVRARRLPRAHAAQQILPDLQAASALCLTPISLPAPTLSQIWPLWDETNRELRIILINKRRNESLSAHLVLPAGNGTQWAPTAMVTRMVAAGPDPLMAKEGVSLGGITFDYAGGFPDGQPQWEEVDACEWGGGSGTNATNSTQSSWGIEVPRASAAMVTIKRLS